MIGNWGRQGLLQLLLRCHGRPDMDDTNVINLPGLVVSVDNPFLYLTKTSASVALIYSLGNGRTENMKRVKICHCLPQSASAEKLQFWSKFVHQVIC